MQDTLEKLVRNAELLIASNYYEVESGQFIRSRPPADRWSRRLPVSNRTRSWQRSRAPHRPITSISAHDPEVLISNYLQGGATALSVLTEPKFFKGSLQLLEVASLNPVPVLMKDFIVSNNQIDAAARHGASAILLIQKLFSSHMVKVRRDSLIGYAHERGLEVVLEAADEVELLQSLKSSADIVGINQRDLRTMDIEQGKGVRLLNGLVHKTKPIIVMSGITTQEQVIATRDCGAAGVLIGTELASSDDPEKRLRGLVVPR